MTREVINELKKYTLGRKNTEKVEINVLQLNRIIKALEQEPCGDWYDVSSNEMTLEQARQAVKDLRKKLAEYLEQEPCEDAISREPFTDSTICEGISCNECSFNRKDKGGCILEERVMRLPSIQPHPKTGYWIYVDECHEHGRCSECGYGSVDLVGGELWNFCPNCGAKMIEPQESEG